MIRKIGLILLCLLVVFALFACERGAEKAEITAYVQSNETEILTCIRQQNAKTLEGNGYITEVYEKAEYIAFYCFGKGFGPAGAYYGFYFSPQDKPLGIGYIADDNLQPQGAAFVYRNSNDDNTYYTEKIGDYLYYYEAHF